MLETNTWLNFVVKKYDVLSQETVSQRKSPYYTMNYVDILIQICAFCDSLGVSLICGRIEGYVTSYKGRGVAREMNFMPCGKVSCFLPDKCLLQHKM